MLEGIGRFTQTRYGFCIVSLCQGKDDDGRHFFAFVAIEPQNYNYFKKNYQNGSAADFSVFGRELLRGQGVMPSPELIEYIRQKYDIEFNVDRRFMERLVALSIYSAPESSPFPNPLGKPAEALGSS